jgi:hypothetical protein
MPIAELFDGTKLEFPEDTDPSVIQNTVKRLTLERQPKPKESLLRDVQRGGESLVSGIRTGISGIFNPNEAAEAGIARSEDITARLGGDESRLSKVQQAYKDKGLLSAAGTVLGEIPSAIAEQAPNLVTAFGGARLGAMAGSVVPGVGTVGGAVVGAFLPFFFSEYGGNIQQQAQLQKEKGEKVDVNAPRAAGFAAPMAGLEVVGNLLPLGKTVIGGMFGKEVADLLKKGATKEAEMLAKEKLAKESFLPSLKNLDLGTVIKGTSKTALLEMPTEITQQLLGRMQSKQDLFSPEALRDYGETAFDVALLGPLGIYGRSVNKTQARNDILAAQKVAAEKQEPQEVLLLTYDPNVQGTVVKTPVVVNPDGSTAFPKQQNQFRENAVDEFTDAGLREAYQPEQAEALPPIPPPPTPRPPRVQPIVPSVMYGTEAGQVGQTVEDVNQAQMFEQIALQKQEQLLRTVTPDTLKSLNIGNTAKGTDLQIYKNPAVVGADLGNPNEALMVRQELLSIKDRTKNVQTQQKIDAFLQQPYFQVLPPIEIKPVKPAPLVAAPDLLTPNAPQDTGVIEQNRDRSKKGYIQQINEIASKPDYTQAGVSPTVTDGAPIVTGPVQLPDSQLGRKSTATFADGDRLPIQYAVVGKSDILPSNDLNGDFNKDYSPNYQGLRVVIGNGRTAGLQLGYSKGTMGNYQEELKNDDYHGISPEVINSIKDPLLIRVAPESQVARYPNIGDKGNIKATAELSVLEQAKNDANRVNLQGLEFKEDGGISPDTVNSFVQSMPVTERTNLLDNNGKPNRRAEARLEAAIFQNAYKSDELTEIAHVDTEGEAKNLINGLSEAAPDLVALGSTKGYDVRPTLVEAVKMAITARRNGMSFAELAQQRDITAPDPLVYDFIEFFAQNNRSGKKIAQGLKDIVNNVSRTVNAPETDIFGDTPPKKKLEDIVRESLGRPALELKQTTPEELEQAEKDKKAQQDKEDKAKKEAEEKEKQEAEKKAITARSEGAAKDFELGQGAEDNLSGQKDLLQTPAQKNVERLQKKREANLKPLPAPPYKTVEKGRKPQVVAAAYARKQGQISRAEYEEYVEEYASFGKVDNPAGPATNEAMFAALPSNKKDKLNVPVANGTKVYLRMDINALERGASVVSIHTNNDIEKMPTSFTSTGHIKNVVFNPRNENTALSIAAGKQSKKPLQTADGTWVNTPPNETYTKVMGLINDPNWTQISVDPLRHSYFYDRGTGQPVVSADEMYQVGRFLLAKNVKYGNKDNYLYEVPYQPTPKLTQDISVLSKEINAIMDKAGLHNIGVRVKNNLQYMVDGTLKSVNGSYLNQVITLSLDNPNIMGTLHHEIIHALKAMGMFSNKEWAFLTQKAKEPNGWMYKYEINRRYPKASEEIKIEEAVASAAADYMNIVGAPKSLLARIKDFFERLGNVLRGRGFMTSDMVFNRTPEAIFRKAIEGRLEGTKEAKQGELRADVKNVTDISEKRQDEIFGEEEKQFFENVKKGQLTELAQKQINNLNWTKEIYALHGKVERLVNANLNPQADIGAPIYWELNKFSEIKNAIEKGIDDINNGKTYSPSINKADRLIQEEGKNIKDAFNKYLQIAKQFQPKYNRSKSFGQDRKDALKEILNNVSEVKFEIPMDGVSPDFAKSINDRFGPPKKATIKEKFEELKPNFFDRLITGVFDEFHTIKKYSQDAYMKAVLSKSIDGGLDGLLMQGQVYIKDGALDIRQGTKGLLEIMRPLGADVERYQVWKALNRDAEVAKKYNAWKALAPKDRGKEPASPSFPAVEVARRDQLLNGDINGTPRAKLFRTALNEENALNRSVLDVAKQQGIIDQEAYDRFSNDIYYIPFYKQMEDGQIMSVQDSSKLTGQYFSKALKGGEKERMGDLMENTLRNWSHILSASMKNAAANSTLLAAKDLKAAVQVKSTYEGKDVITTMIDGKKAYFAVNDPDLVDSISLISFLGPKSPFLDVAKGFTNALRVGVTLAPGYKIRNLFRDTIASAAISPVGLNVLDNVQRGLKLSDRNNPTFVSALAGGGVFELGAAHEGDQARLVKRLIAKGVKQETILTDGAQIKNVLVDMYERYNEFGNRFENANRLALYQKMIDEGKTHLEASFAARDLLNFTSQGSFRAVKVISQLVPFFNTRLQGLYKLGRDGITPTYRVLCNMTTGKPIEESDKLKAQRFSIVSSAVMLASMGLYMAYEDDEDFKKREDWDRDNFWWFKVGDTAYRLPKPFEIGALGTIAERSLEQIRDENAEGKVFYDRMRAIIVDTLSLNPTPQFVKPLIDIYANKDSFTGAPIETSGMERLSKQERVSNNTSELAKALGGISSGASKILTLNPEAQGISPVQMDYAIKAYFGWLGSTVAVVSDKAVQPWSDVEKPGKPTLDQYALGFAKSLPEAQSKYVTNFYENSNRINQAFADMKRYAEQGDMEKVSEIMAEKGNLISLEKVYNQTTDQLAAYRKYINFITNRKDMAKEDKENEILRMKVLISQAAENAENLRKSMKK